MEKILGDGHEFWNTVIISTHKNNKKDCTGHRTKNLLKVTVSQVENIASTEQQKEKRYEILMKE